MEKSLLLIVSGKKEEIIKNNNFPADIISKKIDEKDLSDFKKINKLIKKERAEKIYFSVYSIKYLRFLFFMKLFIFLNGLKGSIVDQSAQEIKFNLFNFIFIDIPKFIFEIIVSVFVVIFYSLRFIAKGEKI